MAITWIHREIYTVGELKKKGIALQNTKQKSCINKRVESDDC